MPWIHIADLVRIFEFVIENKQLAGPYNAVAPQKINNRAFMKQLAHTLNKPFILPPVPAFMLKALLGEMSVIVLTGNDISSGKIVNSGFEFKFTELQDALFVANDGDQIWVAQGIYTPDYTANELTLAENVDCFNIMLPLDNNITVLK